MSQSEHRGAREAGGAPALRGVGHPNPEQHNRQPRGFSTISIVSISSPTWMSLNLPSPIPHS